MMLAAPRFLPETAPRRGQADLAGAVASAVGMTALAFGIVRSADACWADALASGAVAGGVLLPRGGRCPLLASGCRRDRSARRVVARLALVRVG
jgi:hypothetical protein